jgi:cytochrome c
MASRKLILPALIVGIAGAMAWAQGPTYGVGRTPSTEEVRAWDITISPKGTELPQGHGTAKEGAALYVSKGCAGCHGATGYGGRAPMLVSSEGAESRFPCLSPCIRDTTVMGRNAPFATVLWDYINRGMPLNKEGTLTPNEVYAISAFLLLKNGVIKDENQVLDKDTLPKVKMPNDDGYTIPHEWKPGHKPLENYP